MRLSTGYGAAKPHVEELNQHCGECPHPGWLHTEGGCLALIPEAGNRDNFTHCGCTVTTAEHIDRQLAKAGH